MKKLIFGFLVFISQIGFSQADDFHLMTEIDRDNFYISNETTDEIEKKLATIIPDFNRLKEEGYYKTIEIKSIYYEEQKESIKNATVFSNQVVEYFVLNGLNADIISVDYLPYFKNPYTENPVRIIIFYDGWNGKIKEGYEPPM